MDMAGVARRGCVRSPKRKGRGVVIEISFPSAAARIMTDCAVAIEAAGDMIGLLRFFIILLMTCITFSGCVHVLVFRLIDVAGLTVRDSMCTNERKARQLMPCDRFVRGAPPGGSVTIIAAVTEFPLVLILVTRRAIGIQFRKWRAGMAARAGNGGVISRECVSGELVIEGDILLQIVPRCCNVTLHTVYAECSVSFIHNRIGLLGVCRNRNQQHVCKKK